MITSWFRRIMLFAAAILAFGTIAAEAHWLMPPPFLCNIRSLSDPECDDVNGLCEPSVTNFNRDFPMGASLAPSISEIWIERVYPYPDETVLVHIKAAASNSARGGDGLPLGAQRLYGAEIAYSITGGQSWYMNPEVDGNVDGAGAPMDFFTHEVLTVRNTGNIKYKNYFASTAGWAVSPVSGAYNPAEDRPAPNRRCPGDPVRCPASLQLLYVYPYNYDCPWGLMCPVYDTWPWYTVEQPGGWPPATCSKGGENCNLVGYPEGGGDLLDNFSSLDPLPLQDYPNITGQPLVRVNGVPGVDCDIYNGTNGNLHPLCDPASFPNYSTEIKPIYDLFGIKPYKLGPGEGKVKFLVQLKPLDVVDATFYTKDMNVWTAKLDLTQPPLDVKNAVGRTFVVHPRIYDTCGNIAMGSTAPPFPQMGQDLNMAFQGVKDFYYDVIPTDADPTIQLIKDKTTTQCYATDTWCPATSPKTRPEVWAAGGCNFAPDCECCANQCLPTVCDYLGPYGTMCQNTADDGNPPGCGPEFGSNTGMAELREFKISHSASDIYLKLETTGEIIWGCYGSWYPVVGCEYDFSSTLGSKFNAYIFSFMNQETGETFLLLVVPEIPIYGALTAFVNFNEAMSGGLGYNYDGRELEQCADGMDCSSLFPCGVEKPPEQDPCEALGCPTDPCSEGSPPLGGPEGDCDGDNFKNCSDACPCADGGPDSEDGCSPPDPDPGDDTIPAEYQCNSCVVEVQGNKMWIQMNREETLGASGEFPIHATAMHASIHALDFNCILYSVCERGLDMQAIGQDSTPRVNYYSTGGVGRTQVEVREDYTPPEEPKYLEACLGRCDEGNRTDGNDNDGDEEVLGLMEINGRIENYIDEGYNPTSTQIEVKWRESVFNKDYLKSDLTDFGGYQIYISRGRASTYNLFYTMCSPTASLDCYDLNQVNGVTVDRDSPQSDEPYANRTRFPKPYDITNPHGGYGFPGEPINCIVDYDCDLTGNGINEDKDGSTDEGCVTTNCKDDDTLLLPDGQTYWFKARAFDIPRPSAADPLFFNFSDFVSPVKITILRNTYPPDAPRITAAYPMNDGRAMKVVWSPNSEEDMGGYAIYRCPANPLDAVKITQDYDPADPLSVSLAAYCGDPANYRRVNQYIVDNLTGYFIDDGLSFMETGIGDGTATDALKTAWYTCGYQNSDLDYIKDDNCNWVEANDFGVDGQAGIPLLGEGDKVPTPGMAKNDDFPGETGAYQWISCGGLQVGGELNEDLKYCGNIADPSGWWATAALLYNSNGDPLHLYDVEAHPRYDAQEHPPVLFYNGLADGYPYYYMMKAVDSPYRYDGCHNIDSETNPCLINNSQDDTCDNGITKFATATETFCVNPITDRTCDDKSIAYDWDYGGNCSTMSVYVTASTADTQAPPKPNGLRAKVERSGTAVSLTWSMPFEDPTLDHFNVYRSIAEDRLFACVRGGCELPEGDPAARMVDGCQCDPAIPAADQCFTSRVCGLPTKICTNPPYYTIEPQTQGCSDATRNDGCQCDDTSQCKSGTCTYPISICKLDPDNMPPGYAFINDRIDNDGDGVIDEEFAVNSLDDDGDGLVDEDVGSIDYDVTQQYSPTTWRVGRCPTPTYPYYNADNWYQQVRITEKNFTDNSVKKNKTYFYRVTAVDNAMFDPFDESPTDVDPPPPNESTPSFSVVATTRDTEAPTTVTGHCEHPITHLPMPCSGKQDETFCAAYPGEGSDFYGGQMSVWWLRNEDDDVQGYNVYHAKSELGEPASDVFQKINETLIPQSPEGSATQTLCFRDTNTDNNSKYYYAVTAIDSHGNESGFSDVTGPSTPEDTIAPMAPVWGCKTLDEAACGTMYGCSWSVNECISSNSVNCTRYSESNCGSAAGCMWNGTECASSGDGGVFTDVNGTKLTIQWWDHDAYLPHDAQGNLVQPISRSERDFSHFELYRSATDTCDVAVKIAGNLTKSEYVDTDVALDTTYYYCIAAVDGNDNRSEFTTPLSGTPHDSVPPEKPTGLTATPMAAAKVGLGWKLNSEDDLAGYVIYWNTTTNEGSFSLIDLLPTDTGYDEIVNYASQTVEVIDGVSFIDDREKIPGNNYYYKIAAVDIKGNIGPRSDYVEVIPANLDTTAPAYPEQLWTRTGYNGKETGAGATADGIDNDNDGIVDDKTNLTTGQVDLYWTRSLEPDVNEYKIYRSSPPTLDYCACDATNDPQGDCDEDGIPNSVDKPCECSPVTPNSSPFGNYVLTSTVTAATACPGTKDRPYPVGALVQDICTTSLTIADACINSRYWYNVIATDTTGNASPIDETRSVPATPVARTDTTAPDVPAKPVIGNPVSTIGCNNYTTKTACEAGGICTWDTSGAYCYKPHTELGLTVMFTENLKTDANSDIAGYIIYRDTKATGEFISKVAILNNIERLNHCDKVGVPPCYCDDLDAEKVCFFDISVEKGKRYHYKVSSFDSNGNESVKSESNFATANSNPPEAVGTFCAGSALEEPTSLTLSWSGSELLTNPRVKGFRLYHANTLTNPNWQVIDPGGGYTVFRTTSYTDQNLVGGSVSCYMIVTIDVEDGESTPRYTCGVAGEDLTPPIRPSGLIAVPGNEKVSLRWTESSGIEEGGGYNVYRSDSKDGDYVKVNSGATVTIPIYTDNTVENNQLYWYCVKLFDNKPRSGSNTCYPSVSNESSCSNKVSAMPNSSLTEPTMSLSIGKGWNMLAVPVEKTTTATLKDSASDHTKTIFERNADGSYSTGTIGVGLRNPVGKGFWYYSDAETQLDIWGDANVASPYDIQLASGWNLIGNPFPNKIFWHSSKVRVSVDGTTFIDLGQAISEGVISDAFAINEPDAPDYVKVVPGTYMNSGTAYWIFTSGPVTLRIYQ